MRSKFIAAVVSIVALAMPATAMAAGGGSSPAQSGGSGSAEKGVPVQTLRVSLAFGSGYERRGGSQMVRSLQRRLAADGFEPGPIDGLYGPRTAAATQRFQAASGLITDGIAGPRTLTELTSPVPALYPGAGYGPGGSRLVRHLQRLLTRAGYGPGPVDGVYGPHTERAVRRFQAARRLPIDGIADPQTVVALATRSQAVGTTRPATSPGTARPTTTVPAPSHAPAPVTTRRPSGASPLALLAILGIAVAGVVLLVATLHGRRRRGMRQATAHSVGVDQRPVAISNGHDGGGIIESRNGHVTEPTGIATENGGSAEEAFTAGVLCEEQDDPAGAEAAYRRADELGHSAAASNLGVLLERRRDLAGAEAAYRRADERGEANGAFNLAMLLEEQGDLAGAEAAYRRADDQGHSAAASNLGVLLERRRDLAGAEAAYRRADERGDPNGSFNLAVLLEEQSDLSGAEAAYRRADERGPAEVANAARAALLTLRTPGGDSQAGNRKDVRVG
jgi:peptidoglycan hydrolase-like protein with peptidoglycan-binding domain